MLKHHRVNHLLLRHISRGQTQVYLPWAFAQAVPLPASGSPRWVSRGREGGKTLMPTKPALEGREAFTGIGKGTVLIRGKMLLPHPEQVGALGQQRPSPPDAPP
jgi:hypothetical protein